jgi:hypothetical protein
MILKLLNIISIFLSDEAAETAKGERGDAL